jgi:hypothetical protein
MGSADDRSSDDAGDPPTGLDGVTVSLKRFFTLYPDEEGAGGEPGAED